MRIVFDDNDFNKRGQTSRLASRAQVHTRNVTLKRTYITITIFWVGSILAGSMYFVNPPVI